MITDTAREKIDLAYLDDALLSLISISHETWSEPIKYVGSQLDVTSNGELYKAKDFSLPLPPQTKKGNSDITLTVVDVNRELSRKLKSITQRLPGSVTYSVIFAERPDIYEIKPMVLEFTLPTITTRAVMLSLGLAASLREIFPVHKYRPATHPGLF